jgi:mono/diheme cytochrome c family protein
VADEVFLMRVLMLGLVSVIALMPATAASRQSEPTPGKVPFARVCAACHGEKAEGNQGPRLAGITLEYDEFLAKVRHSDGEMPSIPKTEITDDEVKQVFDYLKSL